MKLDALKQTLDPQFVDLLQHLHRGGLFGYWWTPNTGQYYTDKRTGEQKESKWSAWWPVDSPSGIAPVWTAEKNVYFSVNPSTVKKKRWQRTEISDIAALNCVFAEFDAKDFADGKDGALSHIASLKHQPSFTIDSGGGWHCYWLLRDTFQIEDNEDRNLAHDVLYAWIDTVGSDGAAKDLARVLRVPGQLNHKYDPPAAVEVVQADFALLYDWSTILEATATLRDERRQAREAAKAAASTPRQPVAIDDNALIERIRASKQGAKFDRLWSGSTSDFGGNHSSADQSLANTLIWWTNHDIDRADRLFRSSGLMRPKWDEIHHGNGDSYGIGTLKEADKYTVGGYEPQRPGGNERYNGFSADTPDGLAVGAGEDTRRAHSTFPYAVTGGRIVYVVPSADEEKDDKEIPIADFTARIVEEISVEHDGAIWAIAGEALRGGAFDCEIPAADFSDDRLLKKALEAAAGPRDPVLAGQVKHLGPAIKKLTGDVLHTHRFTRTGWADGRFLIPGREPENVSLHLPRKLPYAVGDGSLSDGLVALRALADGIGAERATVILAALLSGPMALAAGWRNERYALFIRGRTGTLKTSTIQTAMAIYGAGFMRDELLTKWGEGATSNAIMQLATAATDLPFLIDNFKPSTGGGDRAFVGLVHNILEGGEKDRLNRASELRESRPVHCWPVFTGEDAPTSDAAALARCLIVPFTEIQTRQNDALARAQTAAEAGHLAAVGRAWLEWLETNDGQNTAGVIGRQLADRRAKWADFLRTKRPDAVNILRISTNLATNELAFEAAIQSPLASAFTVGLAATHRRALEAVALEMGSASGTALEAVRFVEALREVLATGQYRLALGAMSEAEVESAFNDGKVIGWKATNGGAYLLPSTARRAAEQLTGPLNVTNNTLFSQMAAQNYLATTEDGRTTTVQRWGGKSTRVLHITDAALSENEADSVTAGSENR